MGAFISAKILVTSLILFVSCIHNTNTMHKGIEALQHFFNHIQPHGLDDKFPTDDATRNIYEPQPSGFHNPSGFGNDFPRALNLQTPSDDSHNDYQPHGAQPHGPQNPSGDSNDGYQPHGSQPYGSQNPSVDSNNGHQPPGSQNPSTYDDNYAHPVYPNENAVGNGNYHPGSPAHRSNNQERFVPENVFINIGCNNYVPHVFPKLYLNIAGDGYVKLAPLASEVNKNHEVPQNAKNLFLNIGCNAYIPTVSREPQTDVAPNTRMLTSLVDADGPDVQFLLFTRHHYAPYILKHDRLDDFSNSQFNNKNPTKIIIHGWDSDISKPVFTLIRDAYLQTGHYNVIGVDWSVASELEISSPITKAQFAAAKVNEFIRWLLNEGVQCADVHLIGHNLGAYVAALAAVRLKCKVGRITGLDPVSIGPSEMVSKYRLESEDADLVDIIYSTVPGLRRIEPKGYIVFYINGGKPLSGCTGSYRSGESARCKEGDAYRYFAFAIRTPNSLKSYRCNTVQEAVTDPSACSDCQVYLGQENTYGTGGIFYVKADDY